MVNSENELREAGRKRPALNLTLAQKALITTCPQLARVLPCKWPLRNIAGLAKFWCLCQGLFVIYCGARSSTKTKTTKRGCAGMESRRHAEPCITFPDHSTTLA